MAMADKKINLEDFEAMGDCFPKPVRLLITAFKQEFRAGIRRLIQKLDLVTKDELLVQKRLLELAYKEIHQLKQEKNSQENLVE